MQRSNIQSSLANLFNAVCLDEYEIDIVEELEKSIRILDFVFSKPSNEEIQSLVGGELNPNNIMGTSFNPEKYNIPLYLILQLIIKTLGESKYKNKESIMKSIEKLELFKTKAMTLDFDKKFNPNEELSSDIIENIKLSNGLFSMEMVEIEGKECIAINVQKESNSYKVKNGDIYGEGSDKIFDLKTMLYDKDSRKLAQLKKQEKEKLLGIAQTKLKEVGKKYFKNGTIPQFWKLEEELIDKNINPEIRIYLSYLSTDLEKLLDERNINITITRLAEIEKIENKLENYKKEEKQETEIINQEEHITETSIDKSKDEYRTKTPLFNFFRKKKNNQLEEKNGRSK